VEDFARYKAMKDWHNRIGDMLDYVNDKLHPHGFDECHCRSENPINSPV